MLDALKNETNRTYTENGAPAYRSTGTDCLDLFAVCGVLRGCPEKEILRKFTRAYAENPDTAMRILFYARDIRGGLGERKVFQTIVRHLADTNPASVIRNLHLFPEYGRYDDLLVLLGTACEKQVVDLIDKQLKDDLKTMKDGRSVSLLAKWLPSVNTSSPWSREQAQLLCRRLGMREKEYRKTLSALRAHIGIVENNLRQKDYTFTYAKLPGRALFKYRRAMRRHDEKRYRRYLENVHCGKEKMHTDTLYPYDIVHSAMTETSPFQSFSLDTAWKALPDYCDGRNALAVIDGSGSMYWGNTGTNLLPITAAVSLGIYFAEHNRGHFANHFITFSETPRLIELKGSDICQKTRYCMSYNEVANTDLYEVFMLLLLTAVKNHLPQSEMPELLYIISDMEFDCGVSTDKTVFEDAREKFEDYGYRLPQLVYWNVNSRNTQFPVRMDEKGTALISGASPSLFAQMMEMDITPFGMMERILGSERYAPISA